MWFLLSLAAAYVDGWCKGGQLFLLAACLLIMMASFLRELFVCLLYLFCSFLENSWVIIYFYL